MSIASLVSSPAILDSVTNAIADKLNLTKTIYSSCSNTLNLTQVGIGTLTILTSPVNIINAGSTILCNIGFNVFVASVATGLGLDIIFGSVTTSFTIYVSNGYATISGIFSALSDVSGGNTQTMTIQIHNNDGSATIAFTSGRTYFTTEISEVI